MHGLQKKILCFSIFFSFVFAKFLGVKRLASKSHHLRKSVSEKSGPRVRSASTGRDKRSEFQARYWAFLFGNLQRAVDEIYKTVEFYEHLASCQEAILVLENYIREFKALAEFFQLTWDYEKTPLPERPNSLAWEIQRVRKTNAVPRIRNKNLTSPSLSGKSSPSSFSGSNSPCPTIEENKQVSIISKVKSPENRKDVNKTEVLSNQTVEDSIKAAKEKKFEQLLKDSQSPDSEQLVQKKSISLENLNQVSDTPDQFQYYYQPSVQTQDGVTQTEGIHDDNLTLLEYLNKYCRDSKNVASTVDPSVAKCEELKLPVTSEAEKPPSLSDVLKPIETHKAQQQSSIVSTPKSTHRVPIKANYSLRNQTISSKNSRSSAESVVRKSVLVPQNTVKVNRPRTLPGTNIPSTIASSVLIRDSTQPKFQSNLSVRSKTMIEIPKNKQKTFSTRPGLLRKKTSIEDNTTDSSTSTLKASSEKICSITKIAEKEKFEKKTSSQSSNDGWMTVKTKRRSSVSSQRFDQPSASASLPTLLALLNENGEDSDKEATTKNSPTKVLKAEDSAKKLPTKVNSKATPNKKEELKNKPVSASKSTGSKPKTVVSTVPSSKKPSSSVKAKINSNVPSKRVNVNDKSKIQSVIKQGQDNQNFIKRQKSDITGLKIKSLHKEFLRSEKLAPSKRKNNTKDNKVDMNLQTSTLLISQTIDNLYSELGGKASKFPHGNLSSCDEMEDDMESDEDHQKKLIEEQESLERQIRELENTEIDVDTETDETDCEAILCDLEDNESTELNDPDELKKQESFINDDMTLEMRYAPMLADLTQIERTETLATLQELVARDPGRAQKLHLKLSSPSRRRSFHETLKKYQNKQSRAQEKRSALQLQKALKIQQLIQRVEQVKAAKFEIIESRRIRMEEKLQRATENRENYLKNKIKKAHDEEEKLKEIAFIKNIEMQNKRLDLIELCKEQEGRLQDLEQERFDR